jgi:hypothetical protein
LSALSLRFAPKAQQVNHPSRLVHLVVWNQQVHPRLSTNGLAVGRGVLALTEEWRPQARRGVDEGRLDFSCWPAPAALRLERMSFTRRSYFSER